MTLEGESIYYDLGYYLLVHRFQYLTPRVRLTPRDLVDTKLDRPDMLHFICSPKRASEIMSEAREISNWTPLTIYEPIPVRPLPIIYPMVDLLRSPLAGPGQMCS